MHKLETARDVKLVSVSYKDSKAQIWADLDVKYRFRLQIIVFAFVRYIDLKMHN